MDEYQVFWNWFLKKEKLLQNISAEDYLVAELEEKISTLGEFLWEIGPGIDKPFAFTLSPAGNQTLLQKAKEIISLSPKLEKWEFHSSLQIKKWNNYFNVFKDGEKRKIDVSGWKYVLYQFEDDTFDIVLNVGVHLNEYKDNIYGLAEMVINSLIGEETRMEKIKGLEIVDKFDSDISNSKSNIINLRDHLKKISH